MHLINVRISPTQSQDAKSKPGIVRLLSLGLLFNIILIHNCHAQSLKEVQPNSSNKAFQALTVITLKSAQPSNTNSRQTLVVYQILSVLRQFANGKPIYYGDSLEQTLKPTTSRLPLSWQLENELKGKILVAEISQSNGVNTIDQYWVASPEPTQKVIEVERQGVVDADSMTNYTNVSRQSQAFLTLATHTKHPSLFLVFQALRLIKPDTPSVQRSEIARGMIIIFSRADALDYVREYALTTERGLSLINDNLEKQRKIMIVRNLFSSFHQLFVSHKSTALQEYILSEIPSYLGFVLSEPELKNSIAQFSNDLQEFETQRLSQQGTGVVSVTPLSINGSKGYTYSGPVDKVRTEQLVRPLFDILSQHR